MVTIMILAVIGGCLYTVSLQRTPWRRCHVCRGARTFPGQLFRYARADCWRCHGTGRFPRAGIRVLDRARYWRLLGGRRPGRPWDPRP